MIDNFIYPHRNGETTIPEVSLDEFSYYWFDGVARGENWKQIGDRMIAVTGEYADRVVGLVAVTMLFDIKKVITDGTQERNRATMIAQPETIGYDLDKCEGVWYGPVHMPNLSDDLIPSMAAVEDYKQWKRFHP